MSKTNNILMAAITVSIVLGTQRGAFSAFNPNVTTDGGSIDETIDSDQEVDSGGIVYGATIINDGEQNVNDGGISRNTTITGYGIQNINDGGTVDGNTLINNDGFQYIFTGGTLTGTATLYDHALIENIGGTISSNTTLNDNSRLVLLSGTISGNLTMYDNSIQYINGGEIVGNVMMYGNSVQNILNGTVSGSTIMYDNSIQNIGGNGTAYNTIINSGTQQIISGGGTAIDTSVNEGGQQTVNDGAIIGGTTTINDGGILTHAADEFSVLLNAMDSDSVIMLNGGTILINSPASASMTINPIVMGSGILQVNRADSLNFASLSGSFMVYIPDLDDLYSNAFIFYDTTDGVNFTLDARNTEIGEYKVKLVDNGPTLGLSIVEDIESPADFVHNIGRAASMNLAILENLSNSMHKRMGEIQWQQNNQSKPIGQKPCGAFARAISAGMKLTGSGPDDVMLGGIEFGIDGQVSNTNSGRLLLGIMGQYANGNQTYDNDTIDGDGNLNSYAVGLYMTWLGTGGYFVDIAARGYQISNKVTDYSNLEPIGYKTTQHAIVGGIEAGRQIVLKEQKDNKFGWIIVPRAQMNAGYLSSDNFSISNGIDGKIDASKIFNLSAGFITGPRFVIPQWGNALLQPYAKASVKYEFDGNASGGTVDLSMADSSLHGTKYELGLGANILASDKWSLYADGVWQSGANYQSVGGTIGIRATF